MAPTDGPLTVPSLTALGAAIAGTVEQASVRQIHAASGFANNALQPTLGSTRSPHGCSSTGVDLSIDGS
jgi:hypothetical protein